MPQLSVLASRHNQHDASQQVTEPGTPFINPMLTQTQSCSLQLYEMVIDGKKYFTSLDTLQQLAQHISQTYPALPLAPWPTPSTSWSDYIPFQSAVTEEDMTPQWIRYIQVSVLEYSVFLCGADGSLQSILDNEELMEDEEVLRVLGLRAGPESVEGDASEEASLQQHMSNLSLRSLPLEHKKDVLRLGLALSCFWHSREVMRKQSSCCGPQQSSTLLIDGILLGLDLEESESKGSCLHQF